MVVLCVVEEIDGVEGAGGRGASEEALDDVEVSSEMRCLVLSEAEVDVWWRVDALSVSDARLWSRDGWDWSEGGGTWGWAKARMNSAWRVLYSGCRCSRHVWV